MQNHKTESDYLMSLLAKQEYSYHQLKHKLILRDKISSDEIIDLLNEFIEKGWQSDQRYTEAMLASCLHKHYGLTRITQKIVYEKGVDQTLLEQILDELGIDWLDQAQQCYKKKYHKLNPDLDLKERNRRILYLQRQGHTINHALKVLE